MNWQTSTTSSTALSVRAGSSSMRARWPAPRLPSSWSWIARMRLIFVNAVSLSASTAEITNSTNTATSRPQSAPLTARPP